MNAEFHTLKHYEKKQLKQATTSKFHITNRLPNLEEITSLIMYTIPAHASTKERCIRGKSTFDWFVISVLLSVGQPFYKQIYGMNRE